MSAAGGQNLMAQCSVETLFDESMVIEDMDTQRVRIRVSNARVNSLGDNFQGLCGVRLNFDHTNVSDLNMTLVAPNGQQVILIGPATGTGVAPSLFPVSHDIEFRQKVEIVTPDPGFTDIWSSENLSWGPIAGGYNGTYYPFAGDLDETYAGGTVNGVWDLIVTDGFTNQEGILNSIELEFCDTRVTCATCETRVGSLTTLYFEACSGEQPNLDSLYIPNNFDSLLYRDDFWVYQEDSLIDISENPDLSDLQDGLHYVYAINALRTDYDSIVATSLGIDRELWINSITSPGGDYCLSVSPALAIDISTPYDLVIPPVILCRGDSILFDGRYITETGVYTQKISGCDTLATLDVISSGLEIALLPDTVYLDCNAVSTNLDGSSIATQPVTYQWSDNSGAIISDSAVANVTISGNYTLVVDDGICPDSRSVVIISPLDTMNLSLLASTLDLNCRDTSSTISVNVNYPFDSIQWTRTGEYVTTADSLIPMQGGTYEALVFASNGCIQSASVVVSQDDRKSLVGIIAEQISCTNPVAEFRASILGPPAININWRDAQDSLISNTSKVDLSLEGTYSVEVINDNLCDTLLFFDVMADSSTLIIESLPDSALLTCDITSLQLGFEAEDLVRGYWLNPIGDTISDIVSVQIMDGGTYTAGAIGASGCPVEQEVVILTDTVAPVIQFMGDTLSCKHPIATLTAMSPQESVSYNWSGVIDSVNEGVINVSESGEIFLEVMDNSNGCVTNDRYLVFADFMEPNIILAGPEQLSCDVPSIQIENVSIEMINGFWLSPIGDTSFMESIVVDVPGEYTYVGTGSNGCIKTGVKEILDDRDGPAIELPEEIRFDCSILQSTLSIIDTTGATFEWILNQDTLVGNDIIVSNTSAVISIATGENGCEVIQAIPVFYDTITPVVSVLPDTITCLQPIVRLQNTSIEDRYNYTWTAQDGQVISSSAQIEVFEAQDISLMITDTINFCTSNNATTVSIDTISPVLIIDSADSITCAVPQFIASASQSTEGALLWSGPDIDGLSLENVEILGGGTYGVSLTGNNGCITIQEFEIVEDVDRPSISIGDMFRLTCLEPTLTLRPEILDGNDPFLTWTFDGLETTADSIIIDKSGSIELLVSSSNGCDTSATLSIVYDTLIPVASILSIDTIVCEGTAIEVLSEAISQDDLSFIWRLDSIMIAGDINQVTVSSTGTVRYRLEDMTNGCFSEDSINVVISEQPLVDIDYSINDESCLGDNDGLLGMISAVGGVGEVNILIDGMPSDQDMLNLSVGDHTIMAQDALGCMIAEEFVIEPGADFSVELPAEVRVFRDESTLFVPSYTGGRPTIAEWITDSGEFSAIDSLRLTPVVDQTIRLIATSPEGCVREATSRIDVITDFSKIKLYVPNIMNLNSELGNEVFRMQLPDDVLSVDSFVIYDRWGQKVVSLGQETRRDPFILWDGSFKGSLVESGVYMYIYQITTSEDNRQKIITGDLTVVK